jgi:NADPH-dependent curcumin reductase CurA
MSDAVITALPEAARAWHLVSRPHGWPTLRDFALRERPLPPLEPGQLLVRNDYFSVDPYMRRRMDDQTTYVTPFALGEPMDGRAAGVVLASRTPEVAVGAHVTHPLGWRDFAVIDAAMASVVDVEVAPLPAYLGLLGNAGLTAYAGLLRVAELRTGDVVFISGAAGAVGSAVGQMAKLMGASRVIGSTGSAQKAALLTEKFGFDAALDYRQRPIAEQLREAAPDGIDVYFDNVGGEHLEAALDVLRVGGRVVLCGMIGGYNEADPAPGPRNLIRAIDKRLRMTGILVADHGDLVPQFAEQVVTWLAEGRIQRPETIMHGVENGAGAFLDLLRGQNIGKMIVALR